MAPTFNLQQAHSIYHLPAFALLASMQRWHCKIHSLESAHRGSSASNKMHRWCMIRCVAEHRPLKWLQESSSAAFFHALLKLLWIQFKCKATKKMRHLYLLCMYRYLFLSLARLRPISWSHRSHWPFYWLWLAAWSIRCGPNEDGSPLFALLQYPSNILQPIFAPTVVFCCWTVAQPNVFASFILSHHFSHVIVFRPIKWSEGIVKFYYWGSLGRIYCPDNGLDVLQ